MNRLRLHAEGLEPRVRGRKPSVLSGRRLKHEEAHLVLWDVNRALELDVHAELGQVLDRRTRPSLSSGFPDELGAREIRLDQVARHPTDATVAPYGWKRGNPGTLLWALRHNARELRARTDAELRVNVRQVALHRPLAQKQRSCNLPIV